MVKTSETTGSFSVSSISAAHALRLGGERQSKRGQGAFYPFVLPRPPTTEMRLSATSRSLICAPNAAYQLRRALRAVGWMRLFDDDFRRCLAVLSPNVPVCPCASRHPLPEPEVSARVIGHRQKDRLSDIVGNPKQCSHLLLVIEVEGRPGRAEPTGTQRQHQRPRCGQNTPISGCLPKGPRVLKPTLDARDDVHGHFAQVISEVTGGVLYAFRPLLVYGQAWVTRAG